MNKYFCPDRVPYHGRLNGTGPSWRWGHCICIFGRERLSDDVGLDGTGPSGCWPADGHSGAASTGAVGGHLELPPQQPEYFSEFSFGTFFIWSWKFS